MTGAITIPNANLSLQITLNLDRKGNGLAWSKSFYTQSQSEGMIIDHELSPDKAPNLAMEALSWLWMQIRNERAPRLIRKAKPRRRARQAHAGYLHSRLVRGRVQPPDRAGGVLLNGRHTDSLTSPASIKRPDKS